jgi:hypothetical protein
LGLDWVVKHIPCLLRCTPKPAVAILVICWVYVATNVGIDAAVQLHLGAACMLKQRLHAAGCDFLVYVVRCAVHAHMYTHLLSVGDSRQDGTSMALQARHAFIMLSDPAVSWSLETES